MPTAKALHPHYEDKRRFFFVSFGRSADRRLSGLQQWGSVLRRFGRNVLLPKHAPEPNSVALMME
jgi:hypothetical protein